MQTLRGPREGLVLDISQRLKCKQPKSSSQFLGFFEKSKPEENIEARTRDVSTSQTLSWIQRWNVFGLITFAKYPNNVYWKSTWKGGIPIVGSRGGVSNNGHRAWLISLVWTLRTHRNRTLRTHSSTEQTETIILLKSPSMIQYLSSQMFFSN